MTTKDEVVKWLYQISAKDEEMHILPVCRG